MHCGQVTYLHSYVCMYVCMYGYIYVGGQREIEELTEFSVALYCKYSIVHVLGSFFPRTDR